MGEDDSLTLRGGIPNSSVRERSPFRRPHWPKRWMKTTAPSRAVARLGGDEFAVLIDAAGDGSQERPSVPLPIVTNRGLCNCLITRGSRFRA